MFFLAIILLQPPIQAVVGIQSERVATTLSKKEKRKALRKQRKIQRKTFFKALKQKGRKTSGQRLEPLSFLALLFVFAPYLFAALGLITVWLIAIFWVLSPIFATLGLGRLKKQPDRYKGKIFAILALVLNIAILIFAIFMLTSWAP